jgi:hypothetical protein
VSMVCKTCIMLVMFTLFLDYRFLDTDVIRFQRIHIKGIFKHVSRLSRSLFLEYRFLACGRDPFAENSYERDIQTSIMLVTFTLFRVPLSCMRT